MVESVSGEELTHAWRSVGRFMWSFAILESAIDGILEKVFDLNASAQLLLFPQLDLRKKLALVKIALKKQGVDASKEIGRVQQLHDLRNAIAHTPFGPDSDQSRNTGVIFDFANKKGDLRLPPFLKRTSDLEGWETGITYVEFDRLHVEFEQLHDAFWKLGGSCIRLEDADIEADADFRAEAQEAIRANNVIQFPRKNDPD